MHQSKQNEAIVLFSIGPGCGLPEISPYCTKTEIQLQMAGLAYRKERALPPASPKGQLPFIEDAGERIADSTFIRLHIERKYGFDFDAGLDAVERAEAWTVERMLENHLGWFLGYCRWLIPENFAKGPYHFFEGLPEDIRDGVRNEAVTRVTANMKSVGVTRHAPDEIMMLGARSLQALSSLLGKRAWLMGERPCGTDATALAMLAGILSPFFASPLQQAACGHANLVAYAARGMARFYPDHPWAPRAAESPALAFA